MWVTERESVTHFFVHSKPNLVARQLYKKYHAQYDGLSEDKYLPATFTLYGKQVLGL